MCECVCVHNDHKSVEGTVNGSSLSIRVLVYVCVLVYVYMHVCVSLSVCVL